MENLTHVWPPKTLVYLKMFSVGLVKFSFSEIMGCLRLQDIPKKAQKGDWNFKTFDLSGWCFQPLLKMFVKMGIFPKKGWTWKILKPPPRLVFIRFDWSHWSFPSLLRKNCQVERCFFRCWSLRAVGRRECGNVEERLLKQRQTFMSMVRMPITYLYVYIYTL